MDVSLLSALSNMTPRRVGEEGWTFKLTGRTEGRNSHPGSANGQRRGERRRKRLCAKIHSFCSGPWRSQLFASVHLQLQLESNDPKASSFTFHRRMGDFPRRFVRRRWWRISAAVPCTATTRLTTTSESETTESTAYYSLCCRGAFPCADTASACPPCSSSASVPCFISWTEDLQKFCWTSGSISVSTFPFLFFARALNDALARVSRPTSVEGR